MHTHACMHARMRAPPHINASLIVPTLCFQKGWGELFTGFPRNNRHTVAMYVENAWLGPRSRPLHIFAQAIVPSSTSFMLIRMDIYDMEIISGVKVTHAMLEKKNGGWQKE